MQELFKIGGTSSELLNIIKTIKISKKYFQEMSRSGQFVRFPQEGGLWAAACSFRLNVSCNRRHKSETNEYYQTFQEIFPRNVQCLFVLLKECGLWDAVRGSRLNVSCRLCLKSAVQDQMLPKLSKIVKKYSKKCPHHGSKYCYPRKVGFEMRCLVFY